MRLLSPIACLGHLHGRLSQALLYIYVGRDGLDGFPVTNRRVVSMRHDVSYSVRDVRPGRIGDPDNICQRFSIPSFEVLPLQPLHPRWGQ